MRSLFILLAVVFGASTASGQELSRKSEEQVEEAQRYYDLGLYEDAAWAIKKVLFRSSRQPNLQIFAARCYLQLNDPYRAEMHLQRASKIGSLKADQMLDSLLQRQEPTINEEFKDDLEEYLQKTAPESDQ